MIFHNKILINAAPVFITTPCCYYHTLYESDVIDIRRYIQNETMKLVLSCPSLLLVHVYQYQVNQDGVSTVHTLHIRTSYYTRV